MKKIKYILLGIAIGAIAALCAILALYYSTKDSVDWRTYIEGVLLPNAVTAATSIGIIGLGVKPTLAKVIEVIGKFPEATKAVNDSAKKNAENDARIEESRKDFLLGIGDVGKTVEEQSENTRQEILAMKSEIAEIKAAVTAEFKTVESELCDTCKILKLGFGNMDELVKKGSAKEIMQMEVEAGGKQKEE